MSIVTVFKNITQAAGGEDFPLIDLMDGIKSGHWKPKIEALRAVTDKEQRNKLKKQLPYFTGSGTFDKRANSALKQHSGRIIIDIDDLHGENLDNAKNILIRDKYIEFLFVSAGGNGLAAIIKIDGAKHSETFDDLKSYFYNKYKITVDKGVRDVARARFISYDPELYHNPDSVTYLRSNTDTGRIRQIVETMLTTAGRGQIHNTLIRASRLIGGYIGGGVISETDGRAWLMDCLRTIEGYEGDEIEGKKIDDGINHGKLTPITDVKNSLKSNENENAAIKDIYAYAHEINKSGRQWTPEDVKLMADKHLITLERVQGFFETVFSKHAAEHGIKKAPAVAKVEVFLNKNFDLKFNEVTQVAEYKYKIESKFEPLDVDQIFRDLLHTGIKFSRENLKSLLRSRFVARFNPFKDYFNGLNEWDGETDHIGNLASYIEVNEDDREFFEVMFKKMLVRCIKCTIDGQENRIVFVLVGEKQATGKSTFLRFLNPFKNKYYTEAPIRDNKDTEFMFSENFIYNLEELSSLNNTDINRLKAIISKNVIKERKPYAVQAVEQPRRCNFFGSTNKPDFLTDTENTRWLCFEIDNVKWSYKQEIDINKVWAQAFALYKDPEFNEQLTAEEQERRDRANKAFEVFDVEKDSITTCFEVCDNRSGSFYSNAKILQLITEQTESKIKFNSRSIGRSMKQLGFLSDIKKVNGHTARGYYAKFKPASVVDAVTQEVETLPF